MISVERNRNSVFSRNNNKCQIVIKSMDASAVLHSAILLSEPNADNFSIGYFDLMVYHPISK